MSRSASGTDRGDLLSGSSAGTSRTTSIGNLTSSFAQTELNLNAVTEETAKDMIDSGMQASSGMYKERNISVTEEEYEPQLLAMTTTMGTSSGDDSATMAVSDSTTTTDHKKKERYSSVSEGDDVMVDAIGGGAEEVTMIGNIMNILSFHSMH